MIQRPTVPRPFSARKEPAIDDANAQRVRIVFALGIVNLFLAVAAAIIATLPAVG